MHQSNGKIIQKLFAKAAFLHEALIEEHPPEDDGDEDQILAIRALMERSIWGWCCVKTTISYNGFQAAVYLGGCSFESMDAFLESDGKAQALEACAQLLSDLRARVENGKRASEALRDLRRR